MNDVKGKVLFVYMHGYAKVLASSGRQFSKVQVYIYPPSLRIGTGVWIADYKLLAVQLADPYLQQAEFDKVRPIGTHEWRAWCENGQLPWEEA